MNIEEEWEKIRKALDDSIKKAGIKCPKGTIPVRKFNGKVRGIYNRWYKDSYCKN